MLSGVRQKSTSFVRGHFRMKRTNSDSHYGHLKYEESLSNTSRRLRHSLVTTSFSMIWRKFWTDCFPIMVFLSILFWILWFFLDFSSMIDRVVIQFGLMASHLG